MLGKLIEKVTGKRLQFQAISNNFVHPNQLGRLKQWSTTDTGTFLTHLVQAGCVKNLQKSMLAFDITQFFSLLNHQLLPLILDKAGFDPRISLFFSDYLVGKKTQYLWNNFLFYFFNVDIGIEQGSALSSILLALYLSSIFHIFEKRAKNLKIPVSFISFVNDSLFVSQEKSLEKSNSHLFYSYNVISSLLKQFGLIIKHRKTKIFHFSRLHRVFNSPPLDFNILGGPILHPKDT